jgi:hypothetical protein
MRFEPRIGAASSIKAVPNGNGSVASADAAAIANAEATRPPAKHVRLFVTLIHAI